MANPRELLRRMFTAAIEAAQPRYCLPRYLPAQPRGRLLVVGAGKAAAAMAHTVEEHWDGALSGVVVTRPGYAVPCRRIEIIEAAHPVPDAAGIAASERILTAVQGLSCEDLVLCLLSGGGSSLLVRPLPGLTLEDKQAITRSLLKCGATISEINCVRRHLSAVKGGRLAAACHPARVITLAISDVPGDHPVDIASGPTVADPSTCADALAILRRYRLSVPRRVLELLESGRGESFKPGDARLAGTQMHLIATPQTALTAAAKIGQAAGIAVMILGDSIEGEASEVGRVMAAIARQVSVHGQPLAPPVILLSGGETTVTVRGAGRGGRNVQFLLALGLALAGREDIYAIAGDTDGVDGTQDIAGAYLTPDSLERAATKGIDARASLSNNDAHGFFRAIGDALVTGPTLTNVNDFRAILIAARAPLAPEI